MNKKKGQQTGGSAAGLVAIITGLIIVYILLLEPADKVALLEDEDSIYLNNEKNNTVVILNEDPGRLDFLRDNEIELNVPSFNLYKSTDAKSIEEYNDFSIRNGWFDEKNVQKTFFIDDLENTNDIILNFATKKHVGTLSINLNDNLIYEGVIDSINIDPIKLKKQYLIEGENIIDFSVSGVGIAFYKTNEYNLQKIRVIGDVTDITRQKTTNIFTVEPWRYNNLEKVTLKFNPDCTQSNVGVLDVFINDREVFSGVPDCGMLNKYTVPNGAIESGINDIVFTTNKGSYLVDQIKIKLELEELSSPLYWFEISSDQYKNITSKGMDVNLTLEFVEDDDDKELDINVNGHLRRIDQTESIYTKNINSWVEGGKRNYIKLVPKDSVDVVNLKIEIIDIEDDD
jgi:hypothetical protein